MPIVCSISIDDGRTDIALSFSFPLSASHAALKVGALRGRGAIIEIILIKVRSLMNDMDACPSQLFDFLFCVRCYAVSDPANFLPDPPDVEPQSCIHAPSSGSMQ